MAAQRQKKSTNNNKISTKSHKKIFRNIHRKKPVLKSSTCNFIKKETPEKVFSCEIVKKTFFSSNTSERLLLEEHKLPQFLSYHISKGYYQKGFMICFFRSAYGRFMESLIETYNKGSVGSCALQIF